MLHAAPSIKIRRPSLPRRWLRRAALGVFLISVLALLGYGGVVLYMLQIEPSLVYYPSRPDQEWIDKPNPCIQDITLHTGDGAMHAWYCAAEKPDAVLLMCHGNAGNLSIRGNGMLDYRRRFNSSIMVFDYPGYGLSEGQPTETGCYAAAEAAYDWLIEKGFKPEQIIVYGESLGGGVAVDLASRKTVAALILVNTFANLPEVAQRIYYYLPVTLLMHNRFDSESKIARCRAPIFLTHGTKDQLIPPDHSRRLLEKIAAPREYLLRQGKGHEDPLGPEVLDQIHTFLVRQGCLRETR
jgi:fermentation-respiration switch protein FrsA (DUF1100 family)